MFEKHRNPEWDWQFARQLRRRFRAAYPERVLPGRKAITFHLRRI